MSQVERAIFAAGCFWGVERAFGSVQGVQATRVGYTGGRKPQPTYEEVCTDTTGHAEAVEVVFDREQVSFAELLQLFWEIHDPTTPNRQGPDQGSQYRSAVFYLNLGQKQIAHDQIRSQQKKWRNPIVTKVTAAGEFYPAEDYHQKYFEKKGLKA